MDKLDKFMGMLEKKNIPGDAATTIGNVKEIFTDSIKEFAKDDEVGEDGEPTGKKKDTEKRKKLRDPAVSAAIGKAASVDTGGCSV